MYRRTNGRMEGKSPHSTRLRGRCPKRERVIEREKKTKGKRKGERKQEREWEIKKERERERR